LGQLAVGFWNPATGARLLIIDLNSGSPMGDIVFLDAYIDITD